MGYTKINDSGVRDGYTKYRFDLRLNDVRYRKMITCRKSAVNVLYREWEDRIYAGQSKQISNKFFEMLDVYLEHVRVNKSSTAYRTECRTVKRFKQFFNKNLTLSDFKRSLVDDYVSWRRGKVYSKYDNTQQKGLVTNATINREICVLSSFFNWCIRKEYIPYNPAAMCKLKENNQREVRLSKDEIQILLHEAEQIDGRLYNIISLALLTGMRKSEILSLEWKEVNFESSRIMLSSMKTKSRRARVIPITESISGILHSMYDKSNKLVAGDYTANVLRKQWLKLLKRIPFGVIADGTLLCFHDLRHIFAQALLDEGLSLEDIQFLLGHESITTTQERYAMFARPDLKSKISRMDNVVKLSRIAG